MKELNWEAECKTKNYGQISSNFFPAPKTGPHLFGTLNTEKISISVITTFIISYITRILEKNFENDPV